MVHVESARTLDVLILLLHLHLDGHHIVHHLLLGGRVAAWLARVPGVAEVTLACVEHLLHAILMVLISGCHLRLVLAVGRVREVVSAWLNLAQHLAVLLRLLVRVHKLFGVVLYAGAHLTRIVQQVLRIL